MVTGSRRIVSVQTRLFLLIVFFTWVLTLTFFMLQYARESQYKVTALDSRLQMVNSLVLEHVSDQGKVDSAFVSRLDSKPDSLRLSVLDFKGNVIYDTSGEPLKNHSDRHEFREAMRTGHGFTVRRLSSADSHEYFYSATRGRSVVVRSALPYSHSLAEMLRVKVVDNYLILAIAIIMTIIAWIASHSVSRSIKRLRDFANEAEFGNITNYTSSDFPDDELGEISSHIVNLYKILKDTASERDRSLRNVIFEQREKTRIKHQLTNNINHEFKTPVHVIQACLETLETQKQSLTPEQKQELIDTAYANVKRMVALLNDLSIITRISDAPEHIEMADVDVSEIVHRIADDSKLCNSEQHIRVHVNVPPNVIVHGNASLIESIFRNLFSNAFNYSGARDINVDLVEQNGQFYRFRFADNGVGVSQEDLPRLFERFYRVDKGRSRAMGGTGLGLSIVKNAVLFHRGEISVRNGLRGGLEFNFTLHK